LKDSKTSITTDSV